MEDIREQAYASWLESILSDMVEMKPRSIALCAISGEDASISTCHYMCDATDLAAMAAVLSQDGLMLRIESNPEWLRGVINEEDEEK